MRHKRNRWPFDSNLLFDSREKKDSRSLFLEVAKEKNYTLQLPPTVVQELTFAALHKSGEEQKLAFVTLQNLRAWGNCSF